jgi:crotonobetainyl-CoA:carnitine CoA-transferase CaiB-like acyl-CoA transferase
MAPEALLPTLRVVEIGQYVAAPFAATLLADHGAEVVKIERPGGDPYRRDPARFAAWNRGKSSVVLDLSSSQGRVEALELIEGADVVLENLRPGSMARLGLSLDQLRVRQPTLVTCSISAYGSSGPSSDDPGWEPLVHARAGAQQGLFTGDQPIWLPFPMASVAAALLAVLGLGAALVKRETTGYGQHVETSLLEALLFLNGGPIFRRPHRRTKVIRESRSPILHTYETLDGRGMQINLSGTERWRELCRLIDLDHAADLDFADPASLARLSDREWCDRMRQEMALRFAKRSADEWEEALQAEPAAVSKCNTLEEWLAHEQVRANGVLAEYESPGSGAVPLVAPPFRINADGRRAAGSRRHGQEVGALAGLRVIDMSSFWAGPLAARLLAELGADVVKVEPPGGEGAYQLMPALPNIYLDANRSKRGLTLDLRSEVDRRRLFDLVKVGDVVVENAVAGAWERLGLDEAHLRSVNPDLIYARAKGFGLYGPLAARPSFDYVIQAATGMEMSQGDGRPQPVNFTANDYGTGLHLAAGCVLALLARARGVAVTNVEASLMLTATVFQSEHVAQIAFNGQRADDVGADLGGPTPWCHLYRASDGWLVLCAVTPAHQAGLMAALELGPDLPAASVTAIAAAIGALPLEAARSVLAARGVPTAVSVHPNAVPDDVQVRHRNLLTTVRHPVAGPFEQVGIPLWLSSDPPAVKGPAPAPRRGRRRAEARP